MSFKIVMKIDGLGREGGLELQSFSWGATNPAASSGGGGGAGKVQMQDLHFVKYSDKSSAALFQMCATGKHFQKADLLVITQGEEGKPEIPYKISLANVGISSFQSGGTAHGDALPTEQISMNYSKIEIFALGDGSV
jgi:type VI secretion system secreted protein Hcp